jgi:hypothetical protein
MRSKGKFFPLILFALLLIMVPPASAVGFGAPGTTYNSHWVYPSHVPTIDGHVTPGEYANATVRDFTFNMRTSTNASVKNVNARLLVKNDYVNIYAAIQIFNVPYNDRNSTARWDAIALFFDNNHTGVIAQGDQGEEITTNPSSLCYSNHDLYYNSSLLWMPDVSVPGKHEDGALAWNHTGRPTLDKIGNYTVEMKIPLVDMDVGYGLAITTLPKTIGYKVWFYEGWYNSTLHYVAGVYPDNTLIDPTSQTTNAATFGNLILNPLYTLTIIPPTAGGTTSPAPGAYKYDFGEVATVTAIPSGGYAFDHWVLDTFSVGSANPYSVTMNDYKNHTLQAVFRPLVVGGMAAPIIIPVGEPNLLTPLILLTSAIICSIASTVLFAKLKKKKS